MRRAHLALLALSVAGCSAALDPGKYVGPGVDGGGHDLSVDAPRFDLPAPLDAPGVDMPGPVDLGPPDLGAPDLGPPCSVDTDCGLDAVCDGTTCFACDADGDAFLAADTRCDHIAHAGAPRDCDDAHSTVHPLADAVCGDGLVNDCLGGTTDWSGLFARLGVGEIGVLAPAIVVTPSTLPISQLTVAAAYPEGSGGGPNARAVLVYLNGDAATGGATAMLATVRVQPSITLDGAPATLGTVMASTAVAVQRRSRQTSEFAFLGGATGDTVGIGRYDPFAGLAPTTAATSTLPSAGLVRIAIAGGFDYADGTSTPLDVFARTTSAGIVSLSHISDTGTSAFTPGGDMFGIAVTMTGATNGMVTAAAAGAPTPADLAIATASVGEALPVASTVPPRGANRPALAATSPVDGLLAYASVTLTGGGAGLVLVPVSCSGGDCAMGIGTGPIAELPLDMGAGFPAATDIAAAMSPAVAIADLDLTMSTARPTVRFFDKTGAVLPFGSGAASGIVTPLAPVAGAIGTFDDLAVNSAYSLDGSQGVIVVAAPFTTTGSHGVAVGGLHLCTTP